MKDWIKEQVKVEVTEIFNQGIKKYEQCVTEYDSISEIEKDNILDVYFLEMIDEMYCKFVHFDQIGYGLFKLYGMKAEYKTNR